MTGDLPFPLDGLEGASAVLCPDHLCRALREALPGGEAVPFCAGPVTPAERLDAVVLHKPNMHRLDFGLLAAIVARFAPVYADGAFVLYRRGAPPSAELPPEMAVHLGIVEHHLRRVPLPAPGPPPRRRALVVSAYGAGNVGDDAVSLAAAQIARAAGFEEVELSGPGWTPRQVEAADLVVVGGGGLLYDTNHRGEPEVENLGNYTAPILGARLLGKPAAGLGLGTQGILTPLGRGVIGHALRAADLLTVRDEGDVAEMRERVGVPGARLTADLAFALAAFERPGRAPPPAGATERPAGRPLALVVLPSTAAAAFEAGADGLVAYAAAVLREAGGTHEVLLARHSTDDADLCDRLRSATGVPAVPLDRLGVRAALALYRSASLVVAGRYHAVVFAALGGSARILAVGGGPTKTGRLVRHDLPSLRGAWVEPSGLGRTPVADLLARAAVPAAAEVRRLEARALENTALLEAALRAREGTETEACGFPAPLTGGW